MANKVNPNQPEVYQIRIKGQLDPQWTDWFEDLNITLEEDGDTLLTGLIVDQAALHGLLKKVRDLGLPLISVCPFEPGQVDAPDVMPPSPISKNSSISFNKGERNDYNQWKSPRG